MLSKKRHNNVGLLTDAPSLIWVVIAIAGAVFDAAALAPVFKAAEPISDATKLFNKTGDLDLLKADLAKIDGIKGAIYDNIIKSATLQKQATEMFQSVLKPQPGMFKMVILPGHVPFFIFEPLIKEAKTTQEYKEVKLDKLFELYKKMYDLFLDKPYEGF